MKRREYLRWQLAAGACLAGSGLLVARPVLGDDPDLAVARGAPGPAARAAVEMLGSMNRFVASGDTVVLKPNMSFASPPEAGANTHPEVVAAVAAMCREAGAARVLVLDNTLSAPERCLELSGIAGACKPLGETEVYALSSDRFFTEAEIPEARQMRSNRFMKDVLEADVVIGLPTAKSHSGTGVSLSLKNMMGLIADRSAMHWRYDLDTAIVDLNTRLRPALTVLDAQYVLSTNGPYGPGKVLEEKTVAASTDPVALDAWAISAFTWYGRRFAPRQVEHVRLAAERGLGRMDVENLAVARIEV